MRVSVCIVQELQNPDGSRQTPWPEAEAEAFVPPARIAAYVGVSAESLNKILLVDM